MAGIGAQLMGSPSPAASPACSPAEAVALAGGSTVGTKALVIDCGGDTFRAGTAGEVAPAMLVPAGRTPRVVDLQAADDDADWKTLQALLRRASSLTSPAEAGGGGTQSKKQELAPILITDVRPIWSRSLRERLTQIMFETVGAPALHVSTAAALSLYATGRTAGVVLDCGHGLSRAVPILEGQVQAESMAISPIAGAALTEYLRRLTGGKVPQGVDVRALKERGCTVALNFSAESTGAPQPVALPDGTTVQLGGERFCPEVLFRPELLGLAANPNGIPNGGNSVQDLVLRSINKCNHTQRENLARNIVVSGGSSMFPAFGERLGNELRAHAPKQMGLKVSVVAPPDRQLLSWMGGSILASLGGFQDMWMTKADYAEFGASGIHKKCC